MKPWPLIWLVRARRSIRLRLARLVCRAFGHSKKSLYTVKFGEEALFLCCGRCHRNLSVWPGHATMAGILSGEFMKVGDL